MNAATLAQVLKHSITSGRKGSATELEAFQNQIDTFTEEDQLLVQPLLDQVTPCEPTH